MGGQKGCQAPTRSQGPQRLSSGWGLGFRLYLILRVQGFRVQGSGFRVWGLQHVPDWGIKFQAWQPVQFSTLNPAPMA